MPRKKSPYSVYVLRCADNTLYTGVAQDVTARVRAHELGRGARYTRSRGPFEICAVRGCSSKGEALSLEYSIKRLRRSEKDALLEARRFNAFARACLRERRKSTDRPGRAAKLERK